MVCSDIYDYEGGYYEQGHRGLGLGKYLNRTDYPWGKIRGANSYLQTYGMEREETKCKNFISLKQ